MMRNVDIKRAYRFRFYPSSEQEQILARTFGCARFAYNHMLRMRSDAWMQRQERIGYHESSAALTTLKKQSEFAWLNEVSSVPVQQALRHLQTAFANFFAKRARYPQFKRKDGPQSVEYTTSAFKWDGHSLELAKMANLGLSHFAILSTGEKVPAPNTFRKNESKLAKLQRRLAKKTKGSNRRKQAKLKLARLHAKIADSRRDFLHKLSTRLINENQVIAVESLSVSNMRKNRCLSKSISDASWSEFLRQLAYKAHWYGRELIGIDTWFPSSKRCSDCGYTMPKMPLNVRQWACPECGSIHDRDVNAARNVLAAGLAVSAHGETVSPVCM